MHSGGGCSEYIHSIEADIAGNPGIIQQSDMPPLWSESDMLQNTTKSRRDTTTHQMWVYYSEYVISIC